MQTYSHSRISTFEQCPHKFKLKYIEKRKAEVETIEAFLGKLVHKTLEKLYRDLKFNRMNSMEDILDFFNSEWSRRINSNVVIVRKGYDEGNYRKMGERFLRDFYEKHKPFNKGTVIDLEKRVTIPLDNERNMVGIIDRLVDMGNGVYEVHDYKTALHLPIMEELRRDRQLALYSIPLYEHYHDVKKVSLVWHFLQFEARDVKIEKTKEELENLRRETIDIIKKIESEKEFKPKKTNLCDWCEFMSSCPEFKHLFETKFLPKNEFMRNPGVQLVDQYTKYMAQKKDLEEKISKIKEAMIEFAKKETVSAIFGSNFKARIGEFDKFTVKEKEALEEFLVNEGKWREVSFINTFKLSSIIKKGLWNSDFIDKVKKFGEIEKGHRITLSKLKK